MGQPVLPLAEGAAVTNTVATSTFRKSFTVTVSTVLVKEKIRSQVKNDFTQQFLLFFLKLNFIIVDMQDKLLIRLITFLFKVI